MTMSELRDLTSVDLIEELITAYIGTQQVRMGWGHISVDADGVTHSESGWIGPDPQVKYDATRDEVLRRLEINDPTPDIERVKDAIDAVLGSPQADVWLMNASAIDWVEPNIVTEITDAVIGVLEDIE